MTAINTSIINDVDIALTDVVEPEGDRPDDVVVDLRSVTKSFGERVILSGVDLTIRRGEFVAILGASGSGKTTLLRILSSLDHANGGTLHVSPQRSVVFQDARLLPFKRVLANVLLGVEREEGSEKSARALLAEVGLAGYERRWPKNLSGGEAQRVALARALVRAPHLLLLDEPFAALDALTRIRMHGLVLQLWQRYDPAVFFITHDVDEAILLADRVLVLSDTAFSVDISIEIPRDRRRSWSGFNDTRRRLLAELGVDSETGGEH